MKLLKDIWAHLKEWNDWGMRDWIKAGIDYVNLHMDSGGNYFTIVIFFSFLALWTVASSLLLYTDDFRRIYR